MTPETSEPTEGEGSIGRNHNRNRDHKRKDEQETNLVAATNKADQGGSKKQ